MCYSFLTYPLGLISLPRASTSALFPIDKLAVIMVTTDPKHPVSLPIDTSDGAFDSKGTNSDHFSSSPPSVLADVNEQPKKSWRSTIWDALDKPKEERRFLFKLDAVILTMASLGYFIKNLDQINITSAFVSGMKEDLGLHGNELNYMITCWTVGYVIGEIPRYVLPETLCRSLGYCRTD